MLKSKLWSMLKYLEAVSQRRTDNAMAKRKIDKLKTNRAEYSCSRRLSSSCSANKPYDYFSWNHNNTTNITEKLPRSLHHTVEKPHLWCTGQQAHLECGRYWVLWCTGQQAHLQCGRYWVLWCTGQQAHLQCGIYWVSASVWIKNKDYKVRICCFFAKQL